MKKTYINPTTDVVMIQVQQMIAASLLIGDTIDTADGAEGRSLEDYFLGDDEEELFKFMN